MCKWLVLSFIVCFIACFIVVVIAPLHVIIIISTESRTSVKVQPLFTDTGVAGSVTSPHRQQCSPTTCVGVCVVQRQPSREFLTVSYCDNGRDFLSPRPGQARLTRSRWHGRPAGMDARLQGANGSLAAAHGRLVPARSYNDSSAEYVAEPAHNDNRCPSTGALQQPQLEMHGIPTSETTLL